MPEIGLIFGSHVSFGVLLVILKHIGLCNRALCGGVAQNAVLVLFEESRSLLVLRGAVVAVVM